MRARDVEEVMRLQADFVQHQMELLAMQAQELGRAATRATRERIVPPDEAGQGRWGSGDPAFR